MYSIIFQFSISFKNKFLRVQSSRFLQPLPDFQCSQAKPCTKLPTEEFREVLILLGYEHRGIQFCPANLLWLVSFFLFFLDEPGR